MNVRIAEQEKKDRYVAKKVLEEILNPEKLEINNTEIWDNVDLRCKYRNTNFNVEIKARNKSEINVIKFPEAELKEEKLKLMKEATNEGTQLIYMVLLNERICLIYNLDKIDFNNVEKKIWRIKKIQYAEDSEYAEYVTYFIPYKCASMIIDCSNYYKEYYKKSRNF